VHAHNRSAAFESGLVTGLEGNSREAVQDIGLGVNNAPGKFNKSEKTQENYIVDESGLGDDVANDVVEDGVQDLGDLAARVRFTQGITPGFSVVEAVSKLLLRYTDNAR
jgi:hypothetical protein